jgi:hypothetical protein
MVKRTPEQVLEVVAEVKSMLKADPELTLEEALKKKRLQPSTWYKHNKKRGGYHKKKPQLAEVIELGDTGLIDTSGGARRWWVITNDPETVEKFLKGEA